MKSTLFFIVFTFFACQTKPEMHPDQIRQKAIEEIRQTDLEFSARAFEVGIPRAFLEYAAEEVILVRNEKAIRGKHEMEAYFKARNLPGAQLTWVPEKIDAALSGEMGYSLGTYVFSMTDSTGEVQKAEGVYRTFWKKQKDGAWKFVLD